MYWYVCVHAACNHVLVHIIACSLDGQGKIIMHAMQQCSGNISCISECASIQIESNACLKAMMSGIILCDVAPIKCILQRAVRLDIIIFKC